MFLTKLCLYMSRILIWKKRHNKIFFHNKIYFSLLLVLILMTPPPHHGGPCNCAIALAGLAKQIKKCLVFQLLFVRCFCKNHTVRCGKISALNPTASDLVAMLRPRKRENSRYCKDTEPLYHAFMYSLLILLSSIYPSTQCLSLLVTIIGYKCVIEY